MPDRSDSQPPKQDDRDARLGRALRENLRRRKAQARGKLEQKDDTAAGSETIADKPPTSGTE